MKNGSQISKMENEPKIEIVAATAQDAEGIQEVFYRTWLATYPNEEVGITVEDIEDRFKDRQSEEKLTKRRKEILNPTDGIMLIAKENNEIIGLCRIGKRGDNNQLQAIYVLPEYQGRGIGKLLWSEAQKFLDSKKDTIVQVATYNENAIDFYGKLGFQDTKKRFSDEKFTMKSGAIIPEMEMIKKADDKQETD